MGPRAMLIEAGGNAGKMQEAKRSFGSKFQNKIQGGQKSHSNERYTYSFIARPS